MRQARNIIVAATLCLLAIGLLQIRLEIERVEIQPIELKPVCPEAVKVKVEGLYYDPWMGNTWQGTGFFIEDNLIMTAGHVVEDADEITVIWDNKEYKAISWYKETEADIGLIVVDTNDVEPKAEFVDVGVGDTVWALGNPFGVFPVLTKGIVSAIDMPDDFMFTKNMIITDAAINPGNSGGPLFDVHGNIVGVCSWGYNYSQGMSYFVRSEICKLVLDKYKAMMKLKEAE